MGVHENIGFDALLSIEGTIVRDDVEAPYHTIISLDDGRYVLTTECQHGLPFAPPVTPPPSRASPD